MKTIHAIALWLPLVTLGTAPQPSSSQTSQTGTSVPAPTLHQVVSTGADFNVWQWQTYEPMPNGQMTARTHQYTELASGLNHQDSVTGQWVPSENIIESFAGGAVVNHCQHQIIFANDLNSAGAVDMQNLDGKELKSNILGLLYDSPTTGETVQFASIQDSEGQLVATNAVIYTNAFQGVLADVLYENRLDGMDQSVILREQLPSPASLGMTSQDVYLEVITEFLTPPPAGVADLPSGQAVEEPDQAICWGKTSLGHGKAFIFGGEGNSVPVIKRYVAVGGRYFLLERVRLQDIQPALSQLPQQASNAKRLPGMAATHFRFPPALTGKSAARPMRVALGKGHGKGYVLDYTTLSTSYTNFVFHGDTTYFISGTANFAGSNNVFEGGCVIKFATNSTINLSAAYANAQMYDPVVFTCKDDNTVGDSITGSTGNPSGYYANPALNVQASGAFQFGNFRMSYAQVGIINWYTSATISNAQFVNSQGAIAEVNNTLTVNNALFLNVQTNLYVPNGKAAINNATFANSQSMLLLYGGFPVCLTNCILANVTNVAYVSGNYNGFYNAPPFGSSWVTNSFYPFQRVGAGSCYLTNGCLFHLAGTPMVGSNVLSMLAGRTTQPPLVCSNVSFYVTTNFSPQVQRDTSGSPDLGYHYDALDWIFGGVNAYSNITFSAGTDIGWFELPGSGGPGFGISLNNDVVATFPGTLATPCVVARYETVQEGGDGLWTDKGWLAGLEDGGSYDPSNPSVVTATFARFYVLAADPNHLRDGVSGQPIVIQAKHCEFYGGFGGYDMLSTYTNCLFYRGGTGISPSTSYPYQILDNCTFYGGSLNFDHWESGPPYWYSSVQNCAFDSTSFRIGDPFGTNLAYANYNYNAFITGAAQPPTEGANTITVTNFNWQTSWLGTFYLPPNSALIDKGNTTANMLGLYHFTTQTNQTPETNSVVDIGYHYVATDANGIPLDSNGDGIPDYLEDANGNGLVDSGEIGWNIIGDLGLKVIITQPQSGSTLP